MGCFLAEAGDLRGRGSGRSYVSLALQVFLSAALAVDTNKAGAGQMMVCRITRAACFGGGKMGWLQGGFCSVEYVLTTCIRGITRALYIAF
jgi:hypothetical protein